MMQDLHCLWRPTLSVVIEDGRTLEQLRGAIDHLGQMIDLIAFKYPELPIRAVQERSANRPKKKRNWGKSIGASMLPSEGGRAAAETRDDLYSSNGTTGCGKPARCRGLQAHGARGVKVRPMLQHPAPRGA